MSQLTIAILGAISGALATFLLRYFPRIHDEFRAEASPMHEVGSELAFALELARVTLETKRLWPEGQQLRSSAWDIHGARLASQLGDTDCRELKGIIRLLDATDIWAAKLRQSARDLSNQGTEEFFAALQLIQAKLEGGIEILDREVAREKSKLRQRRRAGFAMTALASLAALLAISVPVIGALSGGPAVADGSLARQLQAEIPASSRAICNESAVFEGSYRCAVEFPSCNGQLEASVEEPTCADSVPRLDVLKVYANDDCYEATLFERILDSLPSSQSENRPKRGMIHSGCVEG